MYTHNKKEIWDVEVSPYITVTVCIVALSLLWNYFPFDLAVNFHTSIFSAAIVLFCLYSVGYETIRSLTMLASILMIFAFSVMMLRIGADWFWRLLVWMFATV